MNRWGTTNWNLDKISSVYIRLWTVGSCRKIFKTSPMKYLDRSLIDTSKIHRVTVRIWSRHIVSLDPWETQKTNKNKQIMNEGVLCLDWRLKSWRDGNYHTWCRRNVGLSLFRTCTPLDCPQYTLLVSFAWQTWKRMGKEKSFYASYHRAQSRPFPLQYAETL